MTPLQGEAFQRFMGLSYFSSLMAAWAAIIHGGGKFPRHHDFCALPAFSADLTVKGLIGITVEAEIPVEAVPGHHNFGDEGFDYTVWHVDPLPCNFNITAASAMAIFIGVVCVALNMLARMLLERGK